MKKALLLTVFGMLLHYVSVAQLPDPGFTLEGNIAIVITDPQIDFLSEKGVAWGAVGESVKENNTIENIETIFKLGEKYDIPVFVSPHYYYPHDHTWKFEGALEVLMHNIKMFDRKGPLNTQGLQGSGADWLPRYDQYLENATVTSPHKVYGPESNDLVLQLRKQGIDKVILGGMSGNLCVQAHMHDLLEQGFEVAVVGDATASAKLPGLDGNAAAQTNYRMMASHLFTTKELVKAFKGSSLGYNAKKHP